MCRPAVPQCCWCRRTVDGALLVFARCVAGSHLCPARLPGRLLELPCRNTPAVFIVTARNTHPGCAGAHARGDCARCQGTGHGELTAPTVPVRCGMATPPRTKRRFCSTGHAAHDGTARCAHACRCSGARGCTPTISTIQLASACTAQQEPPAGPTPTPTYPIQASRYARAAELLLKPTAITTGGLT